MEKDILEVLLSEEQIKARIKELGKVLSSAMIFLAMSVSTRDCKKRLSGLAP